MSGGTPRRVSTRASWAERVRRAGDQSVPRRRRLRTLERKNPARVATATRGAGLYHLKQSSRTAPVSCDAGLSFARSSNRLKGCLRSAHSSPRQSPLSRAAGRRSGSRFRHLPPRGRARRAKASVRVLEVDSDEALKLPGVTPSHRATPWASRRTSEPRGGSETRRWGVRGSCSAIPPKSGKSQTTPPGRLALELATAGVRRWPPDDGNPGRKPGLSRIGETGFEPATARPPAGCATRLRHSP